MDLRDRARGRLLGGAIGDRRATRVSGVDWLEVLELRDALENAADSLLQLSR